MRINKIEITKLNTYPIKSLKGIKPEKSVLTTEELKYDYRWMVTNKLQFYLGFLIGIFLKLFIYF